MANKRKLGRRTDHRNALLRNQVTSLLDNGRITTTLTRAKETQKMADRMITLGKKNTLHTRRQAAQYIYKPSTVQKLFIYKIFCFLRIFKVFLKKILIFIKICKD